MIDDDDVVFAAMATSGLPGCFGAIIFIVVVGAVAYVASRNTDECEAKTCPTGQSAELLEGRCLCVEATK